MAAQSPHQEYLLRALGHRVVAVACLMSLRQTRPQLMTASRPRLLTQALTVRHLPSGRRPQQESLLICVRT